jgi:hypothetical protein
VLAWCHVHHEKFACFQGKPCWCCCHHTFSQNCVNKKGILLLLLLIMATLIESVDNMDKVYIPSFNMFLQNQNKTAAITQNTYIKKLSDNSLLSCWM